LYALDIASDASYLFALTKAIGMDSFDTYYCTVDMPDSGNTIIAVFPCGAQIGDTHHV
jgi:hypothetical protein